MIGASRPAAITLGTDKLSAASHRLASADMHNGRIINNVATSIGVNAEVRSTARLPSLNSTKRTVRVSLRIG